MFFKSITAGWVLKVLLLLPLWLGLATTETCILEDLATYSEEFENEIWRINNRENPCDEVIFQNVTGSLDASILSLLSDDTTELEITNSRITRADICTPINLRKVSIIDNIEFPELDDNVMRKCDYLGVLVVSDISIHPSAFTYMQGLQLLDIRNISIKHLTLDYTSALKSLAFIRIVQSEIERINPDVLCPSTIRRLNLINNSVFPRLSLTLLDSCFSLESFVISGDNYHIDDNAFNTMAKLERLFIIKTKIELLTKNYFRALFNLKLLYLSENDIKAVDVETLASLENLEMLSLKYSKIETITQGTFKNLKNLEVLDLTGNRLMTLRDIGYIPSLKKLEVSWNVLTEVNVTLLLKDLPSLTQFVIFTNIFSCEEHKKLMTQFEEYSVKFDTRYDSYDIDCNATSNRLYDNTKK